MSTDPRIAPLYTEDPQWVAFGEIPAEGTERLVFGASGTITTTRALMEAGLL